MNHHSKRPIHLRGKDRVHAANADKRGESLPIITQWLAIGGLICAVLVGNDVLAKQASDLYSKQVALEVSLSDPVMLADQRHKTFLKIGLTGFALEETRRRAPVNLALVIDKSGSMQADEKLEKAKEAAIAAIDRLHTDDIVSIVVYDQGVQVILPATKLTDKALVQQRIRQIRPGGSTALFAGVSKGATEVRKFLGDNRVNRVILLSDGKANVGPDSPSELGELGATLLEEKISVTTMGLGLNYHEDLMTELAMQSNGNHLFIEHADQLISIFQREFDDVLSVVAQEILIKIKVREGLRPIRVLGQNAEIHGQDVVVMLNQLYAKQERFILLEVDVPATAAESTRGVADVEVTYANMQSKVADRLTGATSAEFCVDTDRVTSHRNKEVWEKSILYIANEKNRRATKLRDQGKIADAHRLLLENEAFLMTNATDFDSELLKLRSKENKDQARYIDDANWAKTRKKMVERQYVDEVQQRGYGDYEGGYGGKGAGYGSPPSRKSPTNNSR